MLLLSNVPKQDFTNNDGILGYLNSFNKCNQYMLKHNHNFNNMHKYLFRDLCRRNVYAKDEFFEIIDIAGKIRNGVICKQTDLIDRIRKMHEILTVCFNSE